MAPLDNQNKRYFQENDDGYPHGDTLMQYIDRRHRWGSVWRAVFIMALLIGIIALITLLVSIVNDSFGYTIVINKVDGQRLALELVQERLLQSPNTVTSEDDSELAVGIISDPNGIGFFGNAYFRQNSEGLKLLSVEGVTPNAETAAAGEYPLARPLYLYSAIEVLENNQAANVFLNYMLTNVNDEIETVGYLPVNNEGLQLSQQNWLRANSDFGLSPGQWAAINPANAGGRLTISGSSTVYPLTQHMLQQFQTAGFNGTFQNEFEGSTAGLQAFCAGEIDIAAASRPINSREYELCRNNDLTPLEFQVGTDTLAVVVNGSNDFVSDVSMAELEQIFIGTETWTEVNEAWPAQPIQRYIPGSESGTLDFFTGAVTDVTLAALPKEDLARILRNNVTSGRGRTLEREQRFFESALLFESPEVWNEICAAPESERPSGCTASVRSQDNMHDVVVREVVQPDVVEVATLFESLLRREEITRLKALDYPHGQLQFRSWLTPDFIASPQSSTPEFAGVRTAIYGSLWVVAITILFSFPIGVGAAIYLEEYAEDNRLNRLLQTNINNLAGVPSIIYGMLGLAVFVRVLEVITSGALFGTVESGATANGRTILSAGLTLGLLILPIIIINAQEALRAVPVSIRQAGMALGATKWQTTWHHVLPSALPGILTGTILSLSRALGETAPLVVVGASTFITVDPSGPFSKFTALPIQIYQWTARPQAEFRNIAAAAIIVLLVLLLSLNATAILLRNRFARRA